MFLLLISDELRFTKTCHCELTLTFTLSLLLFLGLEFRKKIPIKSASALSWNRGCYQVEYGQRGLSLAGCCYLQLGLALPKDLQGTKANLPVTNKARSVTGYEVQAEHLGSPIVLQK